VIVGQNVGESVLGSVDGDVCGHAGLVPAHVLQLLVLLGEAEVGVGRHDAVVLTDGVIHVR